MAEAARGVIAEHGIDGYQERRVELPSHTTMLMRSSAG
jgi:hypothetical protein